MGPAGNYDGLKYTCYPHRHVFRRLMAFPLPQCLAYLVLCDLQDRACLNTTPVYPYRPRR